MGWNGNMWLFVRMTCARVAVLISYRMSWPQTKIFCCPLFNHSISTYYICRCTIWLPDIFYQSGYSFMIEPDWKSVYMYGLSLTEFHFIASNEIKTWFPFQFPFAFMTTQAKAWLTSFCMIWEEIYTCLIIKE